MDRFAIKNVRIIDGTGGAPIENGVLVVEGSTIQGVSAGELGSFDGQVLDYAGKTLIPGMMDCHTHLIGVDALINYDVLDRQPASWQFYRSVKNLRDKLYSGVTYVRDCGASHKYNIEMRDAVREGLVEGPDIVACGRAISMTGGHGSVHGRVADGVDEVIKATREIIKDGADQIKCMATGGMMSPKTDPGAVQYNYEELRAIVIEASKTNKKVCTHAHSPQGIMNALKAGIQSIEHGMFLNEECVELMVKQGTYYVPTMVAPYWMVHGDLSKIPAYAAQRAKMGLESMYRAFRMAHKAGIKIAMGTDSTTPLNFHNGCYKELELYVENGMTPMEAIVAATQTPSRLLDIDKDYGTLEVGKHADFVVLGSNPLEDIGAIRYPGEVFKNGMSVVKHIH